MGELVGREHPSKHSRTASGSDFSTFEISRALGTPPPPAPHVTQQAQVVAQSAPTIAVDAAGLSTSFFQTPTAEQLDSLIFGEDTDLAHALDLSNPSMGLESGADLPELLDFSQLDSRKAIDDRFCQLAYNLLHHYRLEIRTETKSEQLALLEIEFYLYKSGCHEDTFTHASTEQGQSGRWCANVLSIFRHRNI